MASVVNSATKFSSHSLKYRSLKKIFLAKCHASKVPNAARVVIKTLDYDDNLRMYFPKFEPFYAHDPQNLCKVGDIALIELLEKQMTRDITHKILQVIYPMGDVRDPISGKLCVGPQYRDVMQKRDELWGQNENAFDYDKAPPRGWQEGKKDWSHKEGYKRWHDFTDRDQNEASW